MLSLSLSRSLSLIHTNKHTFYLTLSSPLALVVHTLVMFSCVCVCVVCALNLKHPRAYYLSYHSTMCTASAT